MSILAQRAVHSTEPLIHRAERVRKGKYCICRLALLHLPYGGGPICCGAKSATRNKGQQGPTKKPKQVPRTSALFGDVNDENLRKQTHRDKSDEIHVVNMFLSFFLDGWSDRAVRWVMRGFDAADSERSVRPESPTSPLSASLHTLCPPKTKGKGGKGKENTTHTPERER